MRAAILTQNIGPDGLELKDVPDPVPGKDEIQVQVVASALNRADLMQTFGKYPVPAGAPADIPGMEYAGEVSALGPGATRFKVGDRVMGIVGGGAFAQKLTCHQNEALPIPAGISFEDAAAFPETFFTAFDAMVLQGKLQAGETVLIRAAGSGVGTSACQIAKAWGAQVIGTLRTEEKLKRLMDLHLVDHGVLSPSEGQASGNPSELVKKVMDVTAQRGANLVLELVSGNAVGESLQLLAQRGRILMVGMLGGSKEHLDYTLLLRKRATLIGTVLRSRPLAEKIELAQEVERQLLPLFASGKIRPVSDSVFPMEQLKQAFSRLSSNQTFGKVVLHAPV